MTLIERSDDPCLQIQVDLSAMLDGELDAPSVRRVMVHSDVCQQCRSFLEGIRQQARLHRASSEAMAASASADGPASRLRRQLMENRQKLARILYELGRGFVLMGLSPDFTKEVGKEPVPVPDMAMRGRPASSVPARVAEQLARRVGGTVPGSDGERQHRLEGLGALAGIATGAGVGALAGQLQDAVRRLGPVAGPAVIGGAAMLVTDVTTALLGVSDPRTWDAASWLSDIVPHLAFGAVTYGSLAAMSRRGQVRIPR